MNKFKQQFLTGPYLIWIIGFIVLPMVMILYYAFTNSDGGFTFEYIAAITSATNLSAIGLSLKLGIICTVICLVLSYPLAMILNNMQIKNQSLEKDGKSVKDVTGVTTGSGIAVINVNNFTSGKQLEAGTYTLTAEYKTAANDTKKFVKTFEVTNSQPAATAALKDTAVKSGTTLKSNLKVVYDGNELADGKYEITAVNGTAVSDSYAITSATNIAKVTLKIEVATGKYVEKEIAIGKTIIIG